MAASLRGDIGAQIRVTVCQGLEVGNGVGRGLEEPAEARLLEGVWMLSQVYQEVSGGGERSTGPCFWLQKTRLAAGWMKDHGARAGLEAASCHCLFFFFF